MFTGIVEELGRVVDFFPDGDVFRIRVKCGVVLGGVSVGDSISVSGVCLTVVSFDDDSFWADVMPVTVQKTTFACFGSGVVVNLERAVMSSTRLGGHYVQGHVQGVADVVGVFEFDGLWRKVRFNVEDRFAKCIMAEGSVTVDGVSLTVSGLSDVVESQQWFEVSLIPETLEKTTLKFLAAGDKINLETDIIARHVERLNQFS